MAQPYVHSFTLLSTWRGFDIIRFLILSHSCPLRAYEMSQNAIYTVFTWIHILPISNVLPCSFNWGLLAQCAHIYSTNIFECVVHQVSQCQNFRIVPVKF